ncbi:MAG: hypothetical protein SD837_02585 [Candidatus Electrothrix scaldis]|nr:MAG: hypothetical protein SD837_02585 [Candidatus Electrothrix sp. GW3-3]
MIETIKANKGLAISTLVLSLLSQLELLWLKIAQASLSGKGQIVLFTLPCFFTAICLALLIHKDWVQQKKSRILTIMYWIGVTFSSLIPIGILIIIIS